MTPTVEIAIRVAAYVGVFAAMAAWEVLAPRRLRSIGRLRRWPGNLGILVVDALVVRLVAPAAVVGAAVVALEHGYGLLPLSGLPAWLQAIVGFVILDLAVYLQHVAFHAAPWLWRLHRMHHADLDIDVTTGVRFHPIEILLSLLIKVAVVLAFGIAPPAVLAFEVALNATSMFNHSNVAMPGRLDRVIRWLIVTPDMHRVHHSVLRQETDSNFGFNLPWWDRLFGTYRGGPAAGHDHMTIGLPIFRDPGELRLDRLLTQPFRDDRPGSGKSRALEKVDEPHQG
jgi:sterol desaturase/sphingolipid hydroxylase (fatty acid hydroxylase superfamily)